jgi:hypothetical protein
MIIGVEMIPKAKERLAEFRRRSVAIRRGRRDQARAMAMAAL